MWPSLIKWQSIQGEPTLSQKLNGLAIRLNKNRLPESIAPIELNLSGSLFLLAQRFQVAFLS
ncbi:hypothetical protein EIKCOROL_00965 [Eikenella corrodens ATCC 23834]|uniref:Uncharacterized protein n=1 Tax=Eikenella corrodens ATCC 23834 TaxID=546274 RepID=C0DUD3_EIKCO|nr:hypothetical protein EIKCOROL_00965 [Eikenella corrodens ATCC 23834]